MTPRETALLQEVIDWMKAAAERAEESYRGLEALGLRRGAAKLEQVLTEETQT